MRSYVSVLHYDGTAWNPIPAPPTGPAGSLSDVFVASRR